MNLFRLTFFLLCAICSKSAKADVSMITRRVIRSHVFVDKDLDKVRCYIGKDKLKVIETEIVSGDELVCK